MWQRTSFGTLTYSHSCTPFSMETTNKSLTLCYVLIFLGIPGSGTSSESLLEGFVSRYFVVFQIFLFPQWFQFIACLVMLWLIFLKKYPSSALHLVYFCHLFGFTPEMWVTDSVCSAYLEDSSQAAVDEGLYFSGFWVLSKVSVPYNGTDFVYEV